MESKAKVMLAATVPDLEEQYVALFKQVFKEDTSKESFYWKFSRSLDYLLGATDSKNQMVGFIGSVPRVFVNGGKEFLGIQYCDVMILDEYRGKVRTGLYQRMAITARGLFMRKLDGLTFVFGFPHKRAMLLGVRTGLYIKADDFLWLSWDKSGTSHNEKYLVEEVSLASKHLSEIDQIWQRMQLSFSEETVGMRDSEYITFRYSQHPTESYSFLRIAKSPNVAEAYIIFKKVDDHIFIMDILSLKSKIGTIAHLAAEYLLNNCDCRGVRMPITEQFSHLILNVSDDVHAEESTPIAIGNFDADPTWIKDRLVPDNLYENLFLTLGDQEST